MESVLETAGTLTRTIREAARRRPFEAAVRDFVQLLASVPDYPVTEFSEHTIGGLKTLAQDVIDHIETRIGANTDSGGEQQRQASAVYEIQRLLEEINRWQHHYLRVP